MAIGPSAYEYNLKLDDSDSILTDTLKILGDPLDRRLKFKVHIAEQTNKASVKACIHPAQVAKIYPH